MSNEAKEKEIRTLEAEIKNLQIKKANTEIEVHSLEKRKEKFAEEINDYDQKKIVAVNEFKKEYIKWQEIKKEAQGIKDDCRAEVAKVKKEWDDLADEAKLITEGKKILEEQKSLLAKDRLALKEDSGKLVARRAELDQIQASLKTMKENQDVREKSLMAFAKLSNDRDVQILNDSANLKKEGERLAFIAKSLEAKRLDFEKMSNDLTKLSNAIELREKELKADLKEVEELKTVWQDKVKDAEASKEVYTKAYNGLAQKEKEVEIKRLQLIKTSKEKITEETLKKLEEEAKKDEV